LDDQVEPTQAARHLYTRWLPFAYDAETHCVLMRSNLCAKSQLRIAWADPESLEIRSTFQVTGPTRQHWLYWHQFEDGRQRRSIQSDSVLHAYNAESFFARSDGSCVVKRTFFCNKNHTVSYDNQLFSQAAGKEKATRGQ